MSNPDLIFSRTWSLLFTIPFPLVLVITRKLPSNKINFYCSRVHSSFKNNCNTSLIGFDSFKLLGLLSYPYLCFVCGHPEWCIYFPLVHREQRSVNIHSHKLNTSMICIKCVNYFKNVKSQHWNYIQLFSNIDDSFWNLNNKSWHHIYDLLNGMILYKRCFNIPTSPRKMYILKE